MNKKFSFLIIALVLITGGYWFITTHTSTPTIPSAHSALVVGTNVGYQPFIFTDELGTVVGFDADVAAEIAQKLQKPLIIKDMAFDALLLALTQGSLDMIIGGISITASRKKTGLLVPHYGDTVDRLSCFYPAQSTCSGLSLKEMAQRQISVCTQAGTVFEDILAQYPGIIVKTLPDISDLCLEVLHGGSDVGILDVDSVRSIVRTQKELHAHEVALPAEQVIDGFGIGVSPKNPALRAEIEAAIKTLKADGTMARLAAHWFTA